MAETNPLGGTAIKPVGWDRKGCEAFQYFLYNPDTGEVLSRTPLSWLKIITFYIFYYTALALFWLACLQIFFNTLPENQPKWLLDESLIGTNPGLGVRPRMQDSLIDSSLYMLAAGGEDDEPTNPEGEGDKNIDYAVRLQQFLNKYENTTDLADCTDSENTMREADQPSCQFQVEDLGRCGVYPYGYTIDLTSHNVVEPCFLLKLNKLINWKPEPVKVEKLDEPEYDQMSENLKRRIRKSTDKNFVWVDCHGRFPADREAITIEYFPSNQGMSLKYFPYKGGAYHQPLVAIKVRKNKMVSFGQLVHLECRVWHDNVRHSNKDRLGLVQLEVMLQPKN